MQFKCAILLTLVAVALAMPAQPAVQQVEISDVELRGLWDMLQLIGTQVLAPAIQTQLQGIALLAAQAAAGVADGGLASLTGLLGKRDISTEEMRGLWDMLQLIGSQVLAPAIQTQLQGIALLAAQAAAGVADGGLASLTGLLGKRDISTEELRGLWDFISQIGSQVIGPAVLTQLQGIALLAAQAAAGVADGGLASLTGLLGKRDISTEELRGLWDIISQIGSQVIGPAVLTQLQGIALLAAQAAAGVADGGLASLTGLLGKRDISTEEMRGLWDMLQLIGSQVLAPAIQTQLQGIALLAAQAAAGVADGGLASLTGLLGKRNVE